MKKVTTTTVNKLPSTRRDHLRKIEQTVQSEWKNEKLFEAQPVKNWQEVYKTKEEKNSSKYMTTFPYPYMNGRLHLGHAFSLSKCEFQSRYQRLAGKNSIFPFAFHCTGMPIQAASNRVKAELKKYNNDIDKAIKDNEKNQLAILAKMGVETDILSKFENPVYWLEYFPELGQQDLEKLGVGADFSRSFITTDRQVYYDKFIQWQFRNLKKNGFLSFGKRYTVFSKQDDQPCADHDRSEGEGVGTQEYTCIKLKVVGGVINKDVQQYIDQGKTVYLAAATLRPETMYGQTNCYVLPTGEYGLYEMHNGDLVFSSAFGAESMSYQELLKVPKVATPLLKLKGSDLVGIKVNAPLSKYKEVYAIPLLTISMTKGTGIVTSVPSDSSDDYVTLTDFQNDEELRKKYNVDLAWIQDYQPVSIINIPEISSLSAPDLYNKKKLIYDEKKQKEKAEKEAKNKGKEQKPKTEKEIEKEKEKEKAERQEIIKEVKDEVYKKGFYSGVMLVGEYKDLTIELAKPKVKADLLKSGDAFPYYETENPVKNRVGELCIVALCDQWMINYGEEKWMQFIKDHINSDKWKSYNNTTLNELKRKVDWLKQWGCSRIFGLGIKVPWDTQYLIESLSDSTIYMSYYTICKYFHSDLYGDKTTLLKPDQVNDDLFDYVLLGKENTEGLSKLNIDKALLSEMRNEFTYWYPMDQRCSGKDLIPNHLTMSLFNHAYIWQDVDMMPRSIFSNGYILLNGAPMSKSKGTFKTVSDIIEEYGADASRLTLADCGDGNDDANFLTELANKTINRLFSFENMIKALINETKWNEKKFDEKLILENNFDLIFDNNINYLVELTREAYENMKYKEVLKFGFYEMIAVRDQYIQYNEDDYTKLNHNLMLKFFRTFFTIMNPIVPHWTEYLYKTYLNPIYEANNMSSSVLKIALSHTAFPPVTKNIDTKMFALNKYLKSVIGNVFEVVSANNKDKKGKGKETNKDTKDTKETEKKPQEAFTKKSKFLLYKFLYYYYYYSYYLYC